VVNGPDYLGGGLVNMVAELELRLSGFAPSLPLYPELATAIPSGGRYLFVLFDGLGDLQLRELTEWRRGRMDASFSTQTSVATATISTGLPPAQNGQIAYLMREQNRIVNTLYCYSLDGSDYGDPVTRLPYPNVAERLARHGRKSAALLPLEMADVPLTPVVFRGVDTHYLEADEMVESAMSSDADLLFLYLAEVDTAAHAFGQESRQYDEAMDTVTAVWTALAAGVAPGTVMVGTADHGHVDIPASGIIVLDPPSEITCHGDDRVVYLTGPRRLIEEWAAPFPGKLVGIEEARTWWGPGPEHEALEERLPDMLLLADDRVAFHFPDNELTMVGYHGGLTEAELAIPLLVASR